ncbi:penicillin-binding protein 2 [bacterium AH-315-E09]|nr:penicillin-binding protein 2 [bacterium AH-315-E09]
MQKNNSDKIDSQVKIRKERATKLIFIGVVSTLLIIALIIRLYYIQIVKHDVYTTEINKQKSINIPIARTRGMIVDRNYIPLVNREEETELLMFPHLFKKDERNLTYLKKVTGYSRDSIIELLDKNTRIIKLPIKNSYMRDNENANIRGIYFVSSSKRYDENQLMTHVIGYINHSDGDGVTGIEKVKNHLLLSENKEVLTVIFDGKTKPLLGGVKALENRESEINHVKLTMDYKIQKISEKAMDKYNSEGSVVISNVRTGEILAMVSRPNFDPNNIHMHIESEGDELFNKSIQMTFPPGSVFKIVLVAEALENYGMDRERIFACRGYEIIGITRIRCASFGEGGHGNISLIEAFSKSCNSTFVQLAQVLGAENIIDMALKMGFGRRVDIGLLGEESGNLPFGDEILGPAIGNISIGQGKISVTPMQVNQMTQIIANFGIEKPLFIIKSILDENYNVVENTVREEERILSNFTATQLQRMMREVMKTGTGKSKIADLANITGGKTGTAEEGESNHAWFTGFYPSDEPEYAITILVQNGGSGGDVAVPIFREIIKKLIQVGL